MRDAATIPFVAMLALVVIVVLLRVLDTTRRRTEDQARSNVDENLALARHSVELQLQANVMAERLLRNQDEIIRLLRLLVGDRNPTDITTPPERR
jgi:sensor domain CHASE-containing protein